MLVVKLGGAAGVNVGAVCSDLARLHAAGRQWILVHGGSAETNSVAEKLGHPPRFLTSASGYTIRHTDPRTLEIFCMVYCGKVNKSIVARLRGLGVNALGLSGVDGGLLTARRKAALKVRQHGRTVVIRDDLSGRIESVNTALLHTLLDAGYAPVISPPAIDIHGQALNVDGDRAAARIAAAVGADRLIILSDVPGLLRDADDRDSLVRELSSSDIPAATRDWARGRMRIKLLAAGEALREGVHRVILGTSAGERPVYSALDGLGTTLRAPGDSS